MRLACLLLLALLASACATRRTLRVDSVPRGADVQLDGQPIGRTPLEHSFEHYGTRLLTVHRPGYELWTRIVELDRPWYSWFPFDIVTEVLLPFGWHDRHGVTARLQEATGEVRLPDLRQVLARARSFRTLEVEQEREPERISTREAAADDGP